MKKVIIDREHIERVLIALEGLPYQSMLDQWGVIVGIRNELNKTLAEAEEVKEE